MRDQHLRVLLEHGGDGKGRNVALDSVEALQRVGAHEEVELAGQQQHAVVHVGSARHDGDVEPIAAIGAVGERLVMPAVLGLRHPVGAEGHLVEGLCRRGRRHADKRASKNRAGEMNEPCWVHDHAAHSVCSPPPCGEGLGVGVASVRRRLRITERPPPRRFAIADASAFWRQERRPKAASALPTRGRVETEFVASADSISPERQTGITA